MNDNFEKQKESAIKYIQRSKRELIEKFASIRQYPSVENPFTIFMAGSPGAGKTETSKRWIISFQLKNKYHKVVRIDADEIRESIPGYKSDHINIYQKAATRGVDKLYDSVLKNNQNVILDSTFSAYEKCYDNVAKSIKKNRKIGIMYIYQDPLVAWNFTKRRGKLKGRYVDRTFFSNSFFEAKKTVDSIKRKFGNKVMVDLIEKDSFYKTRKTKFNIDSVDNHLKIRYTDKSLIKKLC